MYIFNFVCVRHCDLVCKHVKKNSDLYACKPEHVFVLVFESGYKMCVIANGVTYVTLA